jgi:hypothetical protein
LATKVGTGRPAIDPDIIDAIETQAMKGRKPAQILRWLEDQAEFAGRAPDVRTVQRYAKSVAGSDPSAPWSLVDSPVGQARVVLDVLTIMIRESEGAVRVFSRAEADLIARIAMVAPEAPAIHKWRLARYYLECQAKGEPTRNLDALLAFNPWRDGALGWHRYYQAVNDGWIDEGARNLTLAAALWEWGKSGRQKRAREEATSP